MGIRNRGSFRGDTIMAESTDSWQQTASKAIGSIKNGQVEGYSGAGAIPYSYHKGGLVKKSGIAKVKKGERVLTKAQQKKMKKGCRK